MKTYIGIDLGTSGVKVALVCADGKIIKQATAEYPVMYPQNGWTEQNPKEWHDGAISALKQLLEGEDKSSVAGISFGGQMHGLVALDEGGNVIRPCILWNDARSEEQTAYLNDVVGRGKLLSLTGNVAFAGFTAPKILWLKKNEPQNFKKIYKILLPKDYLTFVFTGKFVTDYSDAAGTLLLDVKNRCWSQDMCALCGISVGQLPELYDSFNVVGNIKKDIADLLGVSSEVQIIAGAGDNAAAAVGMGAVNEGDCNVSLGTSGTVFLPSMGFAPDKNSALHSFCHANGKWHLMGCILSAASCRKWWLEDVLESFDYAADEKLIANCDSGDIIFLPYLNGERSPIGDVRARGAFIGLSAQTTRAQMSKAVMEGVAFALLSCLDAARADGVITQSASLCGGGAKSECWRQIIADVLNIPVRIPDNEQGPSFGAAILAMVGCGEYSSVEEATRKLVKFNKSILPDPVAAARYRQKYGIFTKLYPALKSVRGE